MFIENHGTACDQRGPGKRDLAAEAQFILSALEAAEPPAVERRSASRVRYRVKATLHLNTDRPDIAPRVVFTRDMTPHGLGFISPVPLPLGSGGTLHLPASDGSVDTIACNVIRCREMIQGWFDGSVTFKEYDSKGSQT